MKNPLGSDWRNVRKYNKAKWEFLRRALRAGGIVFSDFKRAIGQKTGSLGRRRLATVRGGLEQHLFKVKVFY
jgi:hypothetical protein